MDYDCVVIGGGHAGIEASLAVSRLGFSTLLITQNPDRIGALNKENNKEGGSLPPRAHYVAPHPPQRWASPPEAMIKHAVIRYSGGVRKNSYRLWALLGQKLTPIPPNNNR